MTLIQNQGLRTFIIPEGTLAPLGTVDVDNDRAIALEKEYVELKILNVQQPNKEEVKLNKLNKDELIKLCDEKGIVVTENATKKDIIELLEK